MSVETSLKSSSEHEAPDRVRDLPTVDSEEAAAEEASASAIQRMIALGQMSSGFVHDFRNILAVISAGLSLARRHESDPVASNGFLAGAQEGVDRGLKMATRLLDFTSGHDCEVHAENVNDALRQSEALLRYAAGADTRLILQLGSNVPDFDFDRPQFNAAIMNLVINARDAMPDGGVIQISTDLVTQPAFTGVNLEAYVQIRVQDDGTGMSASVMRRIIDPFFTTKAETGTGLGLPQVDAFVKQAGGFMRIDSAIGAGSVFDLFFPARASATPQ
ncbi:two-component system sensor histidine kinase NtrB [Sphingobium indicum]|uniref:two-component system sensor histidine kinase NtrB n=1 Tax=Sphingobium indicum TaxID=332055 RepID=UPI001E63BB8F|nr:ATP-binding protein [Sphingobium indicum]